MISEDSKLSEEARALLNKARAFSGKKISELAIKDTIFHKGSIGQFMEILLGATAQALPKPDFDTLGIELKTIPMTLSKNVLESTFLCFCRHGTFDDHIFEKSLVYQKIKCILFVPIIGERKQSLYEKIIGSAFYWQPSESDLIILKKDYSELLSLVTLGKYSEISARRGHILQLRPKAPNGTPSQQVLDENGEPFLATPQGFYIRRNFTQALISKVFN